nr:flagellar hook-length control protein FliK [Paracoccus sp. Z118]
MPPTAVLPAGPVEDLAGQQSRLPATVAPAPHLQLADGIVAARNGVVEITLNPHELGRVRVMISGDRTDLQVGMIVERSDTLDLLRRHADLLLRELKDSGVGNAQLEFARQDDGRNPESAPGGGQREAGNGGSGPERGVGPRDSGAASESAQGNAGADGRIEAGRRLDIRM